VGPFLAISRDDIVELSTPWDPARIFQEYVAPSNERPAATLAPEDLAALTEGGVFLFDLEHRWMGRIRAEMRVKVVSAMQVEVAVDGGWWLRWWLRPLATPFRSRLHRWLNRRIDKMLEELSQDEPVESLGEPLEEVGAPSDPVSDRAESGMRSTLEILTPGGRRIYRHTEGSV